MNGEGAVWSGTRRFLWILRQFIAEFHCSSPWGRLPVGAAGQFGLGGPALPSLCDSIHKLLLSRLFLWEMLISVSSCSFAIPSEHRCFLCAWRIPENLMVLLLLYLRGQVHTGGINQWEGGGGEPNPQNPIPKTQPQKPNYVERKKWCHLWLPALLTFQ